MTLKKTASLTCGLLVAALYLWPTIALSQCPCPVCYMVVFPNGGETLRAGDTCRIVWDIATCSCCDFHCAIEFSDGGSCQILAVDPPLGYFDWVVPDLPSDQCLIIIRGLTGDPPDSSDSYFSIRNDLPPPGEEFIVIDCGEIRLDGYYVGPSCFLEAFDLEGTRCGAQAFNMSEPPAPLVAYSDDPNTSVDEGLEPGEIIWWHLNGKRVYIDPPIVWTSHLDTIPAQDFISSAPEGCRSYNLDVGWHLISWESYYASPMSEFVEKLGDGLDVMMTYDDGGMTYDPTKPEFAGIDRVDWNHGYWLRLNRAVAFELCGQSPLSAPRQALQTGWNLVGYHGEAAIDVEAALAPIADKIAVVYGYDGGYQVWQPVDKLHSTLEQLSPGHGYWILANEECLWEL